MCSTSENEANLAVAVSVIVRVPVNGLVGNDADGDAGSESEQRERHTRDDLQRESKV